MAGLTMTLQITGDVADPEYARAEIERQVGQTLGRLSAHSRGGPTALRISVEDTVRTDMPTNGSERHESVGTEAERIINGPRRDAYGHVEESFAKIATAWSLILGTEVTSQQVALMMVMLKVLRETGGSHHRDNLVDIIGYTLLLERLVEAQS